MTGTWPSPARFRFVFAVGSLAVWAQGVGAQSTCNAAAAEPSVSIPLPGNPFQALPSADGCWVFVSLGGGPPRSQKGVVVMRRLGGKIALERVIRLDGAATGMVLTRHDSLLVVANGDNIAFIDVAKAMSGKGKAVLGVMTEGVTGAGRIYANVTADGRILFVSDERTQSITVIDLDKAMADGFRPSAIIGKIPVGQAPIALTFSPNGHLIYTTSQAAPASWKWPIECKPEAAAGADVPPNHSQGAILVINVNTAATNPAGSLVSAVPAGCNPVRLVLSPTGDRAYVSARAMNALLVFDTEKIVNDTAGALIAVVPVGTAPVGIAVIDSGKKLIVTSSNRFAGPSDPQFLAVIAADRVAAGANAVLGSITAGAFPRELRVTADGKTLLLTNFGSQSLQVIDIARLPVQPTKH
jgi:6-phosphogluconolactonase (cycloisomerase 2 family)